MMKNLKAALVCFLFSLLLTAPQLFAQSGINANDKVAVMYAEVDKDPTIQSIKARLAEVDLVLQAEVNRIKREATDHPLYNEALELKKQLMERRKQLLNN